jgi:predicted ATPase
VTKDTERLFVLTGGPGSGKTRLIEALARALRRATVEDGVRCVLGRFSVDDAD